MANATQQDYAPWNIMQFIGCEVTNLKVEDFKTGKKVSIGIKPPNYAKKFFLFAWDQEADAIAKSGLAEGDTISVCSELRYYKDGTENWKDAYKIRKNPFFDPRKPISEQNFNVLCLKKKVIKEKKSEHFTSDEIISMMMGRSSTC